MLSVATALALRARGLPWSPRAGDRFVIPDRDMDDEVFVISDLTIEPREYPTGTILGFNGTTEWALDSVAVEETLWLPREDQLRDELGDSFVALRRARPAFEAVVASLEGVRPTAARDAEEAYALAVLAQSADGAPVPLLPVAAEGFGWRVHEVPDDRWQGATPLDAWSVRDLVNHLVSEHLWAPHLLRGETLEQVGDRYSGDVLGTDAAAAWDAAIDASLRAWTRLEDRDFTVHTSAGPLPVREYAEQMLLDLTVHAWDLARGAGLDDRVDERCVEHVLEYVRARSDDLAGSGVFKTPVETASTAPRDQLLALLGRDPSPEAGR